MLDKVLNVDIVIQLPDYCIALAKKRSFNSG